MIQDEMALPEGKTCGHCVHIFRCKRIYGHVETDTRCDLEIHANIGPWMKGLYMTDSRDRQRRATILTRKQYYIDDINQHLYASSVERVTWIAQLIAALPPSPEPEFALSIRLVTNSVQRKQV